MGLPALGAVALVAVCLSVASADELIGYKPGFRIQTLFKPEVCDHKVHFGDIIYLNYNATLADGTPIGSSDDDGEPKRFVHGLRDEIKGLHVGTRGMCEGERRRIVIPPELGFKDSDRPANVPSGSTLKYDVELAKIELSGLKIEVLHVPKDCKRRTVVGDFIAEHYNGTLTNGQIFDTSYQRGKPYEFHLGEGRVIKGVDIGMLNMCVGERRRITLPPLLGYGSRGFGSRIPPNSTLIFEKELVRIIYGKLRWHRLSGPECSADEKVKTESKLTVFYSGFTKAQVKKYNGPRGFFNFAVNDLNIPEGLRRGVKGMCRGERRRLLIPQEQARGVIDGNVMSSTKRIIMDVVAVSIQ